MGKTVEYVDGRPVKMKKKLKKNKNMNEDLLPLGDGNSHAETDGDHVKKKKKKRKSELKDGETDGDQSKLIEDGDEGHGNLANDNFQKKNKRKRKSSEKAQIKENKVDQNDGTDAEEEGDPKPKKKKTDVVKGAEISMKNHKKKKKIDGENFDTEKIEESTLKTRDMEENSLEKQKVKGKVKKKTIKSVENNKEKSKAKSKSKRVSFSGHVEFFPILETERDKLATKADGLLRGKRFTPEEDEIIKQAVLDYIAAKGLEDEVGLKMVLNCRSHKGVKQCWKEIGLCLPYRPYVAIYFRAHNLFERGEARSWKPEEIELLKELQKKYGNDWKKLAQEFGRHRIHVKDTWRKIRPENLKLGKWSQEEYQSLYDLVNLDLQMKIHSEDNKNLKHGMLRDNIPWTAISEKLTTRNVSTCCEKWYSQLTSSLVAEKKWSDADDYRMIGALCEIDAACVEDVDWDNVLEHRPGEICLKRWNQMVKHIGDYASKSFGERVDILAKRYCPDLAEIREVWDNKPVYP
ncbi:hypothetical protein R6Q59_018968 [Mikania micrantha]|uniref:Uncharacterized protein n=1 Tax=Mikania micrantha TaxID=192012 RepID=A0A5N6LZA0_9ASTR|nr:hypothetical protein E3N88_34712 [Mikania micrantha]